MEELNVLANSYAEENVINVLKESFAKVYADGYRDGYKAREEEFPVDLCENETEFVDLGLPSGTLWASDYERDGDNFAYLPYGKAASLNIPTMVQWTELLESCKWEYVLANGNINEVICIGPNGNILRFKRTGMYKVTELYTPGEIYFWLTDNEDDSEKNSVNLYYLRNSGTKYITKKLFSGYKLPIRMVRTR